MANCPVESMTSGGLFWFVDLTVQDPFYALPVITWCHSYKTFSPFITDSKQMVSVLGLFKAITIFESKARGHNIKRMT
jgi:hypothetical protein